MSTATADRESGSRSVLPFSRDRATGSLVVHLLLRVFVGIATDSFVGRNIPNVLDHVTVVEIFVGGITRVILIASFDPCTGPIPALSTMVPGYLEAEAGLPCSSPFRAGSLQWLPRGLYRDWSLPNSGPAFHCNCRNDVH